MKDDTQLGQKQNEVLSQIVQVRNHLAHSPGGITIEFFEKSWKEFENGMKSLGWGTDSLLELRTRGGSKKEPNVIYISFTACSLVIISSTGI
jgi:hypothetical protein